MRKQRKEIPVNKKRDEYAIIGRQDSTLWLIYHASGAQAGAGGVKGKLSKYFIFWNRVHILQVVDRLQNMNCKLSNHESV